MSMNRFRDRKIRSVRPGGLFLSVVLMAGCFGIFSGAVLDMGKDIQQKEQEHLEQVLNQSAAICYSLEGSYPESLSYLKEQYGIRWDEEKYLVDFESVGNNLPPDIVVIPLQEGR